MNRRITASSARTDLGDVGQELVDSAARLGEIYLALSQCRVPTIEQERALRRTLRDVTDSTARALRATLDLQRLAARIEVAEAREGAAE